MQESPRRTLRLNDGWRFHLGDVPAPLANTHIAAYMNNKAGYARGAAKTNYDDSDWREVQLPHDWSVEGEFSPENHMDAGYLPRGVGWYRRYVRLEESDRGKHIELNFDGVATHCTVYVNGHLLHRNFCGSTPFTIDISDVATYGDALNTIAVKVDATWMEGWWYEGAGIYREVDLTIKEPIHFEDGSIFVGTSQDDDGTWTLEFAARIRTPRDNPSTLAGEAGWGDERRRANDSAQYPLPHPLPRGEGSKKATDVRVTLLDSDGELVTTRIESARVSGRDSDVTISFPNLLAPHLWSPDSPYLYAVRVELLQDSVVVDAEEIQVGFRTIRFDADKGFFLNGQHTFLKGVCLHQDHTGVGAAVPESIERFRLLQLKTIGVNAIRCAHNPPSKRFLDLCDELGFLVMNELRNFGSSPEHLRQLEAVVKRDRHHPSIVLWSICNEEAIQSSPVAANIAKSMVDQLRALDGTRPITGAISGGLLDDVGLGPFAFDVASINYNLPLHDAYHAKHPNVPIIVSETGCTYATRGVEKTDTNKHHFAEDDTAFAPWGATARATWDHIRARPYLAGMFVWTGIDYRGEPTPHEWPSVQSHWGLFDLCCFPKRAARLHKQFFSSAEDNSPPLAGGVGGGGEPRTDSRPPDGSLLAPPPNLPRAREGVDAQQSLSIELPAVMHDVPIPADGQFTLPITIVSPVDEPIEIDIAGPGRLVGVGNGDPTSHVNRSNIVTPFNGLAQVLVRTTTDPGRIIVRATTSEGDTIAKSFVSSSPLVPQNRVPVVSPRHLVTGWRMSPITDTAPDPNVILSDQDMNTWERIDPRAGLQSAWSRAVGETGKFFAVYRAKVTLPKALQQSGARLRFHRIVGEPEFFVNCVKTVALSDGESWELICPASASAQTLTIRLQSEPGEAGVASVVELLPLNSSNV